MIIKISALIYTLLAITVITLMIMRPPVTVNIASKQTIPSENTEQNPVVTEASETQASENTNSAILEELPATAMPTTSESVHTTTEATIVPQVPTTETVVTPPVPSIVMPTENNSAINPSRVIPSNPIAPSLPNTTTTTESVIQQPQIEPQSAMPIPTNVIDTPINSVLPNNTTTN